MPVFIIKWVKFKKKKTTQEFQCNLILLLHGDRLTSLPLTQPTEPPSPHACHSSWSNRTAPSSDLVWGLTQKCSFRLERCYVQQNGFQRKNKGAARAYPICTYRPPGRGLTSHCQSWRKVPAPCWQNHCRRDTWWSDHTGSPEKKPKTRWKPPDWQITASQTFAVILPQGGCAPCAGAC